METEYIILFILLFALPTVICGRSGLFYNDYAYSDGSAID